MTDGSRPTRDWAAIALVTTLFLAPTVGVPNELMLQDTLKSIVVALGTLIAAWLFFWQHTRAPQPWQWHRVMWLPVSLLGYALGSMVWSHTYLAGTEAIRWFIFSLLLWLGINTLRREHFALLAHSIHWGAVAASLWVVLQFLLDIQWFPQGPNPASTFINRNFFAEFVVCTIPFSVWLLSRATGLAQSLLRGISLGLNVVALMMTGTRSALLALVVVSILLILVCWRFRQVLGWDGWPRKQRWMAVSASLGTVLALGSLPTGNVQVENEGWGNTAIERTLHRTVGFDASSEFTSGSGSIRLVMWKATVRMIADVPFTGVGAGAWEVDIPLYQVAGTQLETDYYTHNEYLQLLGEYGLLGWLFIIGLLTFAVKSSARIWMAKGQLADAMFGAVAWVSLLALLLVSGAGFPWHMATTGAVFAVLLAILVVANQLFTNAEPVRPRWTPSRNAIRAGLVGTTACLLLALYVSFQAAQAERKLIIAAKIALTLMASGGSQDPRWHADKARMLQLAHEGIAITPHYRKITPTVADGLARWGDWKNAVEIWQSVASSRPYVTAILVNIGRGYLNMGKVDEAIAYLNRAKAIDAQAPSIRALEVVLLAKSGQGNAALEITRQYLRAGQYDDELLNVAVQMGGRAKDWQLVIQATTLEIERRPKDAWEGWLRLGNLYLNELKDEPQALNTYRKAIAVAPEQIRDGVREQVPQRVRAQL